MCGRSTKFHSTSAPKRASVFAGGGMEFSNRKRQGRGWRRWRQRSPSWLRVCRMSPFARCRQRSRRVRHLSPSCAVSETTSTRWRTRWKSCSEQRVTPLERGGIGEGVMASGTAIATSGAAIDRHEPRADDRHEKCTGKQCVRPCLITAYEFSSDTLRMPGCPISQVAFSREVRIRRFASGRTLTPSLS
jgi:hypothetical protein